jgi:magnesium-transporting ATPase (P-type)
MGWARWTAIAGFAFVALYVAAFAMGIEVGASDREILDYYADSGHRAREVVAYFLIVGAALSFVVFALGLRALIARREETGSLAALALAGGVLTAALVLAGNALSRATAFAAMDDEFQLEPNTRRLFENAGFLLFATAGMTAILLVVAVSLAAFRYATLPRWLGWVGVICAVLLPLSIVFIGFLVLGLWVIVVSGVLVAQRE